MNLRTDLKSYENEVNELKSDTSFNMLDRVVSTFSNSVIPCYNAAKANTKSNNHQNSRICSGAIFDNIDNVCNRLNTVNSHNGLDELRKESVKLST